MVHVSVMIMNVKMMVIKKHLIVVANVKINGKEQIVVYVLHQIK